MINLSSGPPQVAALGRQSFAWPCSRRGSSSRDGAEAVRCTSCQHENRNGRKFCESCGSALPALCDYCSFANEAAERVCGGCGRPLVQVDVRPKGTGPDEHEGDRRTVTVLFCDLVGY